ncbi:MAG TPA: DJ-1/PfpI family protein [Microthrixaceae bacterium]|nr:DJ-1/PfpI family protein [Microthrixaceae bacterium]HMT23062.1 DJ-1/PfpI family protein [Microthrixaceae bacterium]HMT59908.1 DJ-1/PfpI family protein [Microthrixaceae bacterium]
MGDAFRPGGGEDRRTERGRGTGPGVSRRIDAPSSRRGKDRPISATDTDAATEHDKMSAMTARTNRQLEVAFVVAPGAELVDIAGPWGVFEYTTSPTTGRSPFALSVVAETADPLKLSGGMRVVPGHTFTNCRTPDIVVVPAIGVEFSDGLLDWLRASHGHASVTMSVCNGAFALAAAGLLDGRTATCHHGSYRLMQSLYPTVTIERGVRWVDHGDIATAGGLTSGTDLALRIVDRLYGADAAALAASQLEYFGEGWRDPTVNAEFATDPVPPPGLALDPVCGMAVNPAAAVSVAYRGSDHAFCCDWCRDTFLATPERFTA